MVQLVKTGRLPTSIYQLPPLPNAPPTYSPHPPSSRWTFLRYRIISAFCSLERGVSVTWQTITNPKDGHHGNEGQREGGLGWKGNKRDMENETSWEGRERKGIEEDCIIYLAAPARSYMYKAQHTWAPIQPHLFTKNMMKCWLDNEHWRNYNSSKYMFTFLSTYTSFTCTLTL